MQRGVKNCAKHIFHTFCSVLPFWVLQVAHLCLFRTWRVHAFAFFCMLHAARRPCLGLRGCRTEGREKFSQNRPPDAPDKAPGLPQGRVDRCAAPPRGRAFGLSGGGPIFTAAHWPLYTRVFNTWFFDRPENVDIWGLGGPGGPRSRGPQKPFQKVGAEEPPPIGIWGPRGRPDPKV